MNGISAKQCLRPNCVIKKILKLECIVANFELQGMQNVYHHHINAFSFKTVQKHKSTMFY